MHVPNMIIGGQTVAGASVVGVVNPATGEVFAEAPVCSPAQLDTAFAVAAAAFAPWRRDEDRRRALLSEIGPALIAASDELVELLVLESGKQPSLAALEISAARMWLDYYAGLEMSDEVIADDAAARIMLRRAPLGVVAAIVPWNFPLVMTINKIAPAIRAGNTVVLKPSPFTPLASLRVGEILADILPAGVVNIVNGGDDLGAAMTAHPVPRKVTFTGSIVAGKHVATSAAADLKRVTLELGGNDAAILLDDIDIEAAIPALLERAFFNVGQTCAIPKRVFVPDHLYDDVIDALAQTARSITLGTTDDTQMGPLSTRPQYERVCRLVSAALDDGLSAVTGGSAIDGPGFYFEPTILAEAREGVRIVDEEQFGPALPVMRYRDVDDAVARANATMFGLCGSVWGSDLDAAEAVARRLECGVTFVNAHGVHRPTMPMLGAKWSGLGIESGELGLHEFTQPQVVYRAAVITNTALT